MSNPYDRLEELDKRLGVARSQLQDVNSKLETLGPPPYEGPPAHVSPDPVPGETLSKEVPPLTLEEQQQKAASTPNRLELHTSLSIEKNRLEDEIGGLEKERLHVQRDLSRIDRLSGELERLDGQIDEAKAENIEALNAYGDKITELKDVTHRRYDIRDLGALKELDGKVFETRERLSGLQELRNDIVLQICDVFHGDAAPDLGTAARHSKLEIGASEELRKITGELDNRTREEVIHLGKEVTDAPTVTEEQIRAIRTNTGQLVPYPTQTQQTVGACERPWTEFMATVSAVPDMRLALALSVGAVCVFAKNLYERFDPSDPENIRAREVKQLCGEYADDMRHLGKEQLKERVALTESLQGRHVDEATIETLTAKQRDLHTDQINQRQTEWDQRFSEMWKRHETELTPYDREKLAAPSQVLERIDKWELKQQQDLER